MPGGLWTPGALWQFRQNLRAPDHTGVGFVQSSTEPTTWQWEYTLTEDDLPLLDTFPRGWQPRDSHYSALFNVLWYNGSGASQTYNIRLQAQNDTFGTFGGVTTGYVIGTGVYGYFRGLVQGVNAGTALRLRLWATLAQDILGLRLILVPRCYGMGNFMVCVETIHRGITPNTFGGYFVECSVFLQPNSFPVVYVPPAGAVAVFLLTPMEYNRKGARLGGFTAYDDGTVIVTPTSSATLYSNGYYGFYDFDLRVLAFAPLPIVTSHFPSRTW